jgi:hypothetical protein
MFASLSRCLCLVALTACTLPTEVIVSDAPASSTTAADGGATTAATCAPASAEGWTATWVPPTGASQGACAAQDLSNLYAACFGASATDDTCNSYQSNNPTCAACVLSASTDSSWGPVVVFGDTTTINQPGCLALVDPAEGTCAQAAQAQTECEHALCDPSCPVSDSASLTAWQQCVAQADDGACAAYGGSTCLASALAADGGGDACGGADFATAFTTVATVFCGSSN